MIYYEAKLSNGEHWNHAGGFSLSAAAERFVADFDLGPEPEDGYCVTVREVYGRNNRRIGVELTFRVKSHTRVVYEATQL